MYGLVLENILGYLRVSFNTKSNQQIIAATKLPFATAVVGQTYPEGMASKLGKKACAVLGLSEHELYEAVGVYFMSIAEQQGYWKPIARLGRNFRYDTIGYF